jgi:hypothetical protein
MLNPGAINTEYFKDYRKGLGFTNQAAVKSFFGAKDIVPGIDPKYLDLLRERLHEIVDRIDRVVAPSVKVEDVALFKKENIDLTLKAMQENKILPGLNNQGRRPEQVFFSWMRGFIVSKFFIKALGEIFSVDPRKIDWIGEDDFKKSETFKRTPTADLEISISPHEKIRIEMQSGFTGINDIKQHKVLEAKRIFRERKIHTLAIHFDLYNGQAAFLKLDAIEDDDVNWITRQQMEGQTVFNIDQNYFIWKLTDKPVQYTEIAWN